MMFKTKHFACSVSFAVIVLISSCTNVSTEISTRAVTAVSTNFPSTTSENTPTPSSMPTEIPIALTTLPNVKLQCASNSQEPQKLELSGVVALHKAAKLDDSEFGFYLLNLKNGNVIRDIDEGLWTEISPDRKYLAYKYLKGEAGFLSVLNSQGAPIADFEFKFDGQIVAYFNWQNAQQLRVLHERSNGNRLLAQLLDPFTQEYSALSTNWNGVYTPKDPYQDELVQWKFDQHATEFRYVYGANILYDPSLKRVLYPKANGVVTLVNVDTLTELANGQFEDWGRLPSWSPDGQYLSLVNNEGNTDEFYLLPRNGSEFQRITNFSKELDFGSISESAWSPDSKQIAFWLNAESGEQEASVKSELAILDVASRQVTNLCIPGISVSASEPWMMSHPEPIWSPDGRYIMITQWDDPLDPQKYSVLVVDPLTGSVTRISENTAPIGWMVTDP